MNRRGFTLPELLIFTAIFAGLVVGLATTFVTLTEVQSRQSSGNEVQTQGQFLTQQIQYYIQSARLVDMPQSAPMGTLKLREANTAQDPTFISISSGTVNLQQGTGGALQPLTSGKVVISNLLFTRHFSANAASAYGTDSVSYSFTMAINTANATQQYSQTFQGSVAVRVPVPQIARLQQAQTENASAAGLSLSYPTANATGSLLIAIVSNTGNSSAAFGISDTAGNSWTMAANPKYSAYNQEVTVFYAPNAKNASNSVTVSSTVTVTNLSLFIYEYRGASTVTPFDASSTQLQAATASPSSGSATPASPGAELVMGILYSNPSGVEIPNPGSGFAVITTSSLSAAYVEEENIYVTGPVAATWRYPTQTPNSSALVVTFGNPSPASPPSGSAIWVADGYNCRAEKFDADGTYLSQFGSYGSGNGQFVQTYGVAIDASGNVYVGDFYSNRVEKFNASGTYLSQLGCASGGCSSGSGNGQFEHPQDIAIDASGNVYVADPFNNRVQKFNAGGTYLSQLGCASGACSQGSGNGQFNGPHGLAIDTSGNVYVVDQGNNRVQKFNASGTYLSQFGSYGSGNGQFIYARGIAINASGNVYVADFVTNRVEEFNASGTYLSQLGCASGACSQGSGNGQFYGPIGIAIDASGNVYVADFGNNRVQKFNAGGTYLSQLGCASGACSQGSGNGQFYGPIGIAIGAN